MIRLSVLMPVILAFNIAMPADSAVEIVGSFNGWVTGVDAHRDPSTGRTYAYALQGSQVHIYDVASLRLLNTLRVPAFQLFGIHVSGSRMALAAGANGAFVYGLENPAYPTMIFHAPFVSHEAWLGMNRMVLWNMHPIRGGTGGSGQPIAYTRIVDIDTDSNIDETPSRRYPFYQREHIPHFLGTGLATDHGDAMFYSYTFVGLLGQWESGYLLYPENEADFLTPNRQPVIGVRDRGNYRIVVFGDAIKAYRKDIHFKEDDPPVVQLGAPVNKALFDQTTAYLQSGKRVTMVDFADPLDMKIVGTREVPFEIGRVIDNTAIAARHSEGLSFMRLDGDPQPEFRIAGEYYGIPRIWGENGQFVANRGEGNSFSFFEQTGPTRYYKGRDFDAGPEVSNAVLDATFAVLYSEGNHPALDFIKRTSGYTQDFLDRNRIEAPELSSPKLLYLDTPFLNVYHETPSGRYWRIYQIRRDIDPKRATNFGNPVVWIGNRFQDRYCFVRPFEENRDVLHCMDMSDPSEYPIPSQHNLNGPIGGHVDSIQFNGRYLCVLNKIPGNRLVRYFRVFDISDLNNIRYLGEIDTPKPVQEIEIGSYLLRDRHLISMILPSTEYRIEEAQTRIVAHNLENGPWNEPIGSFAMNNFPNRNIVTGIDDTFLIAGGQSGIHIFRVSENQTPVEDWTMH